VKRVHWILAEDLARLHWQDGCEESIGLLSPFDNLTRDRKWLNEIFQYTFDIEYFQKKGMRWQVSILCDNEFLGFIDAKMDRPRRTFIIKEFAPNKHVAEKAWIKVFRKIVDLASFHKATSIKIAYENAEPQMAIFRELGFKLRVRQVDIAEQSNSKYF